MTDPWAFGWTQVLTIVGLLMTFGIAVGGFRTFNRWKREKLEEKRIDVAIDALSLVYESKYIFDHIRSVMAFGYEWQDMPDHTGDTPQQRDQRGPYYATLKRIEANKEFFDRAWKMQVKCTAVFGREAEQIFLLMQKARREIEVSAGMLYRDPEPTHKSEDNLETWKGFKADVWSPYGKLAKQGDQVGKKLKEFEERMETLCRPIIDQHYKKVKSAS